MTTSDLFTTSQACERLNCSRAWLNRHRELADVQPMKLPGRNGALLYTEDDLQRIADSMGRTLLER